MENKPCRVLFVDDDKVDQLAFKRLVAELELAYDATISGSVAEARQALAGQEFDIVIADYRLGDGTAFDLIEHIRATPVVFVTGSGSEEVAVRAMHVGASDYLIKDPERNYLKVLPATVEHALARVRAEAQVRKLTKALEESPVAVIVTDRDGRIEYVNPCFTLLTGYGSDEAIGKTPRILKSGVHPPEFYRRMWAVILSGRVWRGELQNRKRDGTLFWAAMSISPLRSPAGDITNFVAVAEDVSDRRRAEEMLRENERNFHALAENASDGILIAVDQTGHVYANRRIEEMTGRTREQLLALNLWELAPVSEQQRLKENHVRIPPDPASSMYQTSILRPDGTLVPVEITVATTVWRGRPGVLRVVRDISERARAEQALRDSEEKHRTLVERSNAGIAIIQDGLVKYANPKLVELSGRSQAEILGRPFVEFVRPDERHRVISLYQRRMRGESADTSYETVFRRPDGSSAYVEVNAGVISFEGRPADFVVVHDMTQRREAEAALADRESALRRLVNQVPAIFWTTDRELKFTSSVGAGLARLNLMPGQVVGMSLNDFFRTDDPEALPIAAHRRALAGQSVTYVMEWQGNAYDSDVEPLYDDHGKVIGTVGVAVDITQLVRAETALQEREENFRQLAANASDGIIISAPAGRLLYVNPKAGVITGYAAEELLTVDFCRLIQDPIDAARLGRVAEELQESRSSPPTELLLTRKDGSAVHLEVSTAFTTWQGQPAVMHILRDITERKQAEYALREERDRAQSYLDIAGGIIIALDARGVVTLINRAGAAILGLTPDEVIGRDWYDSFVPEPTRAARRAVFNHLMAEKASGAAPKQVHEENAIVTRDGIKRIIAWHDTVIRDRQGRPTGMLSSGYDITERKQAEEEQERLIRELDAYAHTVAHDLNGPLSAVIGFAELLKQNERVMADADAAENITHIEASGNRIRNIIEELLLLASVRKTNVVARPVDMSRVVQAALGRLVFMIKEHKPKVVLPDVWPEALGHAPWLEEVWANYFSNAMKYGGRPPLLEVGGRALEAPFVLYWVKDNGPGLRPEEQQKLFLPFTRIHEDASTGHGLGLSIVRRIMDKLGGEVWLESTPGQGSKFGFILPAVKQASARSDDGGGHGRASRHPRPRKK